MPKFLQRHGLQSSSPAALPVTGSEFFPQNVPVIRLYDWALRVGRYVLLLVGSYCVVLAAALCQGLAGSVRFWGRSWHRESGEAWCPSC